MAKKPKGAGQEAAADKPSPVQQLVDRVSKMSRPQRILVSVGTVVVIIGLFGYLSYYPNLTKFKEKTEELSKQEDKLKVAQRKASELPNLEKLLKSREIDFRKGAKLLPKDREIPNLLSQVSGSAREAGLEILTFKPGSEEKLEMYARIPVTVSVLGPYHGIGTFFDKVSKLYRIVNLKDISIAYEDPDSVQGYTDLVASCTAETYRFLDTDESAPEADEDQNATAKKK